MRNFLLTIPLGSVSPASTVTTFGLGLDVDSKESGRLILAAESWEMVCAVVVSSFGGVGVAV